MKRMTRQFIAMAVMMATFTASICQAGITLEFRGGVEVTGKDVLLSDLVINKDVLSKDQLKGN